jgi:hypothetical protein
MFYRDGNKVASHISAMDVATIVRIYINCNCFVVIIFIHCVHISVTFVVNWSINNYEADLSVYVVSFISSSMG